MTDLAEALATRSHAVLLRDGGRRIALLRDVTGGRVRYWVPGAAVEPGETPGRAAARAAEMQLGVSVDVGEIVYADTESGAEHFFFFVEPTGHAAGAQRIAIADRAICEIALVALLGYEVEPRALARRLARLRVDPGASPS